MTPTACPICLGARATHGRAVVRGRHEASYSRCPVCGFVSVEAPHWLDEAYATAISSRDTGLLFRTEHCKRVLECLILLAYGGDGPFLDYGGGYGLMTRSMRDRGFPFQHFDPYCENLFAQAHEWDRRAVRLLTAFEVAEHMPDPLAGFSTMFESADDVLISTELVPKTAPRPGEWWYYDVESGQHVSFYTVAALERIAAAFGRHLTTNGHNLHLFSRRHLPGSVLSLSERRAVQAAVRVGLRRRRRQATLLIQDSADLLRPGS